MMRLWYGPNATVLLDARLVPDICVCVHKKLIAISLCTGAHAVILLFVCGAYRMCRIRSQKGKLLTLYYDYTFI